MKKILSTLTALIFFINCFQTAVFAHEDDETVSIIVKVSGEAVLEAENAQKDGAKEFLQTKEARDIENAAIRTQSGVKSRIASKTDDAEFGGYSYTHVFNGFSMEVKREDIPKIEALKNVEAVYEDREYTMTEPENEGSRSYFEPFEMTNAYYLHSLGIKGEGTVIAIVDSEVDTSHEFLSGEVDSPRLTKEDIADVQGLNAESDADSLYKSAKVPFAYNYQSKKADTYSLSNVHGSHVAGIAAGKNGTLPTGDIFNGTAPEAQILCMTTPGLKESALLAALDDAVKLNADVINCSWGASYSTETTFDEAAANITNAGIMLAVAGGNDSRGYENGGIRADMPDYGGIGAPANIHSAVSVASVKNPAIILKELFKIKVDDSTITAKNILPAYLFNTAFAQDEEYVYCGLGYEDDFADAQGKIAVVKRGTLTFAEKFQNAQDAGAKGIIIINNAEDRPFAISTSLLTKIKIPAASVGITDGETLIAAENKKLSAIGELYEGAFLSDDIEMSSFSSWGTASDLELKPDIAAPGGNIYSSLPDGEYGYLSGTSMATPAFSGCCALIKQYLTEKNGETPDTALIEKLLMSSADVIMQSGDIPYSPRLQGAGLVNLKNAVETPVFLTGTDNKAKIELGSGLSDTFSLSFTAENTSDTDAVYNSVHMCVMTDDCTEEDGANYVAGSRKLAFSANLPTSITVPANSTKTVTADVSLSSDKTAALSEIFKNGFFVEGYVFMESDELPTLSIPFMGFYGDWTAEPLFDGTYFGGNSLTDQTYLGSGTGSCKRDTSSAADKDTCTPIGTNTEAAEDDDEYDREEFAGISPNGDGIYDYLCISFVPLRHAKDVKIYITDENGRTLLDSAEKAPKYHSSHLDLKNDKMSAYADGDYTITIEASTDCENSAPESVEMRFYVDTAAPEIAAAAFNGDTLSFTASDGRHIMCYEISGTKTDGTSFDIKVPVAGKNNITADADITDADISSVKIKVTDYAMNSTEVYAKDIEVKKGDVDLDGDIDENDPVILLRYLSGSASLKAKNLFAADVVGNDKNADITDVSGILRMIGETD